MIRVKSHLSAKSERKKKQEEKFFTGSVDIVPEIVPKPEIGREKRLRSSRGSARSFSSAIRFEFARHTLNTLLFKLNSVAGH